MNFLTKQYELDLNQSNATEFHTGSNSNMAVNSLATGLARGFIFSLGAALTLIYWKKYYSNSVIGCITDILRPDYASFMKVSSF